MATSLSLSSRIVAALLIAAGSGGTMLRAQAYMPDLSTPAMTIGGGFAGGASVNLDAPLGSKIAPIFAYRIAADMTYPLTPGIYGTFALAFDSRGAREHSFFDKDVYEINRINYLSIMPGLNFNAFWFGLNFCLPLSGSITRKEGAETAEVTTPMPDDLFEKAEILLEPSLGATIPLYQGEDGWLGLTVMGGISLNVLFDRGSVAPQQEGTAGSYQMASVHMGLSYQFAIAGTSKK